MSATALATFAVRIFLNDSIIGCNRIAGGEEICISFATEPEDELSRIVHSFQMRALCFVQFKTALVKESQQ